MQCFCEKVMPIISLHNACMVILHTNVEVLPWAWCYSGALWNLRNSQHGCIVDKVLTVKRRSYRPYHTLPVYQKW